MKITKDEKLLFCGTSLGNIIIFDVQGTELKINKVLFTHSNIITSISINEDLNMFASSSTDGYINIYLLPSFSIVRSIAISKKIKCDINDYDYKEQQINEYLYADIIPDIANAQWEGKVIFLCYDSDMWRNLKVKTALYQLAAYLISEKNAIVKIILLPNGEAKGLDDYLMKYGAEEFQKLMDNSKELLKITSYFDYSVRNNTLIKNY